MFRPIELLSGAVLTMAAMGVLYIWSLFLLPLEEALGVSRAALSLAPAIALSLFTLGMVIHHSLLHRFGRVGFAVFSFALAGGGFLFAGAVFTYPALLIGYAVLFGLGCGSGYGLALALASDMPEAKRGISIGVTTASFAISGVAISAFLPQLIETAGVRAVLIGIGIALLIIGAIVSLIVSGTGRIADEGDEAPDALDTAPQPLGPLLLLGFLFFALCYPGLTFVAHSTAILAESGVAQSHLAWGPMILNTTYIAGSLIGGVLVQKLSSVPTLRLCFGLLAFGLSAALFAETPAWALAATGAVGMVLGGAASIMPQVIAERFGAASIGPIYGRLSIGYGLAGLIGPWMSALLFEQAGDYSSALLLALALTALAGLATFLQRGQAPAPRQAAS